MQQNVEMASPKQISFIKGLSSRLDVKIDIDPTTLTKDAASEILDELQQKERKIAEETTPNYKNNNNRDVEIKRGLAFKLVYQRWISLCNDPLTDPQTFQEEVDDTYDLMEVEVGD